MDSKTKTALELYVAQRKKLVAFNYLNFVIGWDNNTEAARGSIEASSEQVAVFSEMQYLLSTEQKFVDAVETLYENRKSLDNVLAHEIVVLRKQIDQTKKIPMEEFVAFQQLLPNSYASYVEAKNKSDFQLFRPTLQKIIEFLRKKCQWLKTDETKGYDVQLDLFEPGFTMEIYDRFFNTLKSRLVPFVKKVTEKQLELDESPFKQIFEVEKQREFCEYLREVLCFDKSRGIMKESEHPFTSGFGTDDVRITTHYYPDNFVSAIFSTIHETGHALYMQQVDKSLNGTFCTDGASMGMHESQSRFYENIIGRSLEFWQVHYKKLQQLFPAQLKNVSVEHFVKYINKAEKSFVRIEADELTYPLHIMLRYDMEKQFVDGNLEVEDFPAFWNKKFNEYFGMTPKCDKEGVLQDIHWAGGDVGYFPTYALGSAIASQLFAAMNKDFDVFASLSSGTTQQINNWLREKVHKFGASKFPLDILKAATGEDFQASYYVDYLVDKFGKLYGVDE